MRHHRGATGIVAGMTGHHDVGPAASPAIRRLSHSSTNEQVFALARPFLAAGARVLDLGAGEGYFSSVVGDFLETQMGVAPSAVLAACDAVPGQFRYRGVPCDPVGPGGRLPYDAGAFDLVCSLEVIEHVEDQFAFLREAHRVLKPGGTLVASTPNVLNMNSRWRTLHSGFAQLFDPLPLEGSRDIVHTSGHIHPVSYYYLAMALRTAGFRTVSVTYDHVKRSAVFQLLLFSPAILVGRLGFLLRMRRKRRREMEQNREYVATMNSWGMLTSRSVIVVATK